MKNANTRFVRVLALVLVVLMVVPAALVGCGSNKANNAAISEALAAAEAARKEAEEAKAAADAAAAEAAAKAAAEAQKALEEANKKAEEAIKAAEQAKKDAEQAQKDAEEAKKEAAEAAKTTAAPATTAPVTTAAPAGDLKVVSDYAYQVLSNKDLDFLKTYLTYAYGKDEDAIALISDVKNVLKVAPANDKYTTADLAGMEKLYDATIVAIYQANTVDYINQLVANFVAAIAGTPTYVERVVAAYEAIDFASDYDVLDVVYANALVVKALTEMNAKDQDTIKKYGEDEINLVEKVYTEYYRYTGVNHSTLVDESDFEEEDILYAEMYEAAQNATDGVIETVYDLFSVTAGDELDVSALLYFTTIDDALDAAQSAYEKWNAKYFVKSNDADLTAAYEAFRQAFVGEDYVLKYENDYAWEAVAASATRVEQLLAAAEEAKALVKTIKGIASIDTDPASADYFKYEKQITKVESAKADLDAWKVKYDFKDNADGTENANVKLIIEAKDAGIYDAYKAKALIVEYFAYLEKTASAINVDAFIDAAEEDLNDVAYNFNFKKYGSAVGAVIDWYFGKAKTVSGTTVREGGFIDLKAAQQKGFNTLGAEYDVANLISAKDKNIATVFDKLFDIEITGADATIFTSMKASYEALAAKKKSADDINDDIEELVEMGVTVKALTGFAELFDGDYEKFAEADDDEKATYLTASATADINAWAKGVIVVGDDNFEGMIDWASLDTIYNNYKESLKTVIADSSKVALEYISWQAAINGKASYDAEEEQIKFTYNGNNYYFSDLKPAQIDIYSYDRIKNVITLEKTLEDLFDAENAKIEETLKKLTADVPDDDEELNISLTAIVDYCTDMVSDFYSKASKVHSAVESMKKDHPLINSSNATANNKWKSSGVNLIEVAMLNRITGTNGAEYDQIKGAVETVLNSYKYKSTVGYGASKGTAADLTIWTNSYQGAIYSVDPIKYAVRNEKADDKITGFDDAGYKAALNAAIEKAYGAFLPAYIKDASNAAAFTSLINKFTTTALTYGLWTIEGDVVIDDETYSYTINSTGATTVFTVYDSADEKVTADIALKIDGVEYKVALVPAYDYNNGKVVIEPTLTTGTVPATKKDVYDLLGLKKADLTYDVRDYANDIAANYMKVSKTPAIGFINVNYQYLTLAEINNFFKNEISNDFYATFALLRARVYNYVNATSTSYGSVGNYVSADLLAADAGAKDSITIASKLAYNTMHGMTPDSSTIADVEDEFNKYATRVKAILTEAGIAFDEVDGGDGYKKLVKPAPALQ